MVLWWREHFLNRIDIESLNTDYVLSIILKIESKNAMKPSFYLKCDVFSNTIYLLKTCFPKILTQISQGKQSGNNADAVLDDFTDLESESLTQYFSG